MYEKPKTEIEKDNQPFNQYFAALAVFFSTSFSILQFMPLFSWQMPPYLEGMGSICEL